MALVLGLQTPPWSRGYSESGHQAQAGFICAVSGLRSYTGGFKEIVESSSISVVYTHLRGYLHEDLLK